MIHGLKYHEKLRQSIDMKYYNSIE